MSLADYRRSVFINCPFDEDYDPILQALLFCVVYLGFKPRLSRERNDSAEVRLHKIQDLIQSSAYSIHDLSRCQAKKKGEYYRLNMPFELGLDYGCRQFLEERQDKKILILEEKQHRYQAALSDFSGCDIQAHGNKFDSAVRKVRNWFVDEAGAEKLGADRILCEYEDFQGWYYEKQMAAGFSEADIKDYSTKELLEEMVGWMALDKPVKYVHPPK